MLRRITVLSLTFMLMLGGPMALPLAAQQNQNPLANALAIPVVGTVTGAAGVPIGTFSGIANITRFARIGTQLVAVGTLTGLTNVGGVVQSIAATFTVPVPLVPTPQASCEILNLVLGPINLDLLGLVIVTNQIVLNITAVPGAGNLLGNLLCSVAGLLDGGLGFGELRRIVNVLNDILAAL